MSRFRCQGYRRWVLISIGAVLLFSGCDQSSSRASSRFTVVSVSGTVAGAGYGYLLERSWQTGFSQEITQACSTLTSGAQQIAYLAAPTDAGTASCAEPAGVPLYVGGAEVECSTFAGNHGTFGPDEGMAPLTSVGELPLCSKQGFKGTTYSSTVDGRTVDLSSLVVTTGVFPIAVIADNSIGLNAQGNGEAAATGVGILLTGVSKGTHVISIHSGFPGPDGFNTDYTFKVRVS